MGRSRASASLAPFILAFLCNDAILTSSSAPLTPQCDYRPHLHPATDVVFIVPDQTLAHLVQYDAWKGVEAVLDMHSLHPKTRQGIVQYGKDGTRGIVQKMTYDREQARRSFRSSLLNNDVDPSKKNTKANRADSSLMPHQVYMDSAGLVEVLFGTLSSFTSSNSKDSADIKLKASHLGLRPDVPWHVILVAVANGRRRVTLSSEPEWEVTQRFFDAIRPHVRQILIEVFLHDECLNNADRACRHVIGDPSHESSYQGRIGGFNAALTLSRALKASPVSYAAKQPMSTSPKVGGEAPPATGGISMPTYFDGNTVELSQKDGQNKRHMTGEAADESRSLYEDKEDDDTSVSSAHARETRAVSLQSRLLIAGGYVRVYPLTALSNNDELLASISTLVAPPPFCDFCSDISRGASCNSDAQKETRKARVERSCVSSHGCVPTDHISLVFDELPHQLSWDSMGMSPLSRKGADLRRLHAEKMGRKAGIAGKKAAQVAREAVGRRMENNNKGQGLTIDDWLESGFNLKDHVPRRVVKKDESHGFFRRYHTKVRELRTWPGSKNLLERLVRLQSDEEKLNLDDPTTSIDFASSSSSLVGMGVEPVLIRGGCVSTWPALVHWRNLGMQFLSKLGHAGGGRMDSRFSQGKSLLVEAQVRERGIRSDVDHETKNDAFAGTAFNVDDNEEVEFYFAEWDKSQMGMAGMAQTRSGDFETLRLNASSKDGVFILQDLFLHAAMPRPKTVHQDTGKKESTRSHTNSKKSQRDGGETAVLAANFMVQLPKWSAIRDDLYPDASLFLSLKDKENNDQYVWLSTPGTAVHTKFDRDHLVFGQVRGRRRFTLWGSRAEMDLNLFPRIHPMKDHSRWSKGRQLEYVALAGSERSENDAVPRGIPSWQVDLNPGEMLYVPPYTFYRAQVLMAEAASRATAKDAGTAAAADAELSKEGGGSAETARKMAEEAAMNFSQVTDLGRNRPGFEGNGIQSDVAVTVVARSQESFGLKSHIDAALEIELCADTISTIAGRIFALRLHLDMLANRIVGFESIAEGECNYMCSVLTPL